MNFRAIERAGVDHARVPAARVGHDVAMTVEKVVERVVVQQAAKRRFVTVAYADALADNLGGKRAVGPGQIERLYVFTGCRADVVAVSEDEVRVVTR